MEELWKLESSKMFSYLSVYLTFIYCAPFISHTLKEEISNKYEQDVIKKKCYKECIDLRRIQRRVELFFSFEK